MELSPAKKEAPLTVTPFRVAASDVAYPLRTTRVDGVPWHLSTNGQALSACVASGASSYAEPEPLLKAVAERILSTRAPSNSLWLRVLDLERAFGSRLESPAEGRSHAAVYVRALTLPLNATLLRVALGSVRGVENDDRAAVWRDTQMPALFVRGKNDRWALYVLGIEGSKTDVREVLEATR